MSLITFYTQNITRMPTNFAFIRYNMFHRAEFEKDEEEQRAIEANQASADAKPAAARDASDDEASTKSSDSEYTGEEGSNHFSEGNVGASYDDEEEDDDDSAAKEGKTQQDEEVSLYKEDEENVNQEDEDEEREEGETEEVNQAIFSELNELKMEVADLKAKLDAKDNELESANDENIRLTQELAQANDKIEQMREWMKSMPLLSRSRD